MPSIYPSKRPQMPSDDARRILASENVPYPVALVGVRGYYLDSMGAKGANDRGIYDDAMFLVTRESCRSYNFNTDPSAYRRGIATLKPGLWLYKVGIHGLSKPKEQRYTALVQAGEVTVTRDGQSEDTGWFGINIHRGGEGTTSSLGCQTIIPAQWNEFILAVKSSMASLGQITIPYLLVTEARRRDILSR